MKPLFSHLLRTIAWLCLLAGFLSGCTPAAQPAKPVLSPTQAAIGSTPLPSLVPSATPTATPEPPTPTPSPPPSATPTASPTPLGKPMTIDAMRAGSYPGSDITLEQELAPGSELPPLLRLVSFRWAQNLRIADRPGWTDTAGGMAGNRLQPRVHPSQAVPHHRALYRLR